MNEVPLTESIFMLLVNNYNAYFISIFDSLMDSFGVFFRGIMVLYTVFIGYMYMTNRDEGAKLLKSYLLVAMFYTFVMETDLYMYTVYEPFMSMVEDLSTFFLQGKVYSSVFATLDDLAIKFIVKSADLWPSGSWWPSDYIFAIVGYVALYGFFFTMIFAFLAIYVISFFSMCLFLLLGGIFILLGCIDKTRSMFFAWLKNLLQFAFTIIFASIILGITSDGVMNSIDDLGRLDVNNFLTVEFFGFIGWCAITIVLFLKSADFAAGLTGTIAGSTVALAGGMARAGGLTASAAGLAATGAAGAGALSAHGALLSAQGGVAGASHLAGRFGMSRTGAVAGNALELLKAMRGIK
jgi:hypothetical protein